MDTELSRITANQKEIMDYLGNAKMEMRDRAGSLAIAMMAHTVASQEEVQAKQRIERYEDAFSLDPNITIPYTNERQRASAVRLACESDDQYLTLRRSHEHAIIAKGGHAARVEELRSLLSIAKRDAEMAVALMRVLGAD